ncbi:dihydrodipicolinate synthase family protein [Micromonospora sp. WMMB482]|uniref:dihydrodipicolinate synthase family protein n=1 Tax=Micromonospora sp. WMMB482 TaxID=2849653 RepID=UPI0027DFAA04|nr:dihydrodipicolinate synthase family protein [Micromonospora sp. WMMB482]
MKTAGSAVPVIAGCIEPTTRRVVERAEASTRLGADGLVVTAPFYAIVGPHEIERHFRAVAAAVELPLLAYDIPVCVHSKLSVDLLTRSPPRVCWPASRTPAATTSRSASSRWPLPSARRSATSACSRPRGGGRRDDARGRVRLGARTGQRDPAGYVRLHRACMAGDWAAARREQDRLTRLFRIVDAADPATSGRPRGVGALRPPWRCSASSPATRCRCRCGAGRR